MSMPMKQDYVEIELEVLGHRYKKKIYDLRVGFIKLKTFGNQDYIHYCTYHNCGKPTWFEDKDVEKLYKIDAGVIELKHDGTYTITKSYNPFLYIERFIKSKLGLI